MYITQVNSPPPQQSFGFKYTPAKRRKTVTILQERISELPNFDAGLSEVVRDTAEKYNLPAVRATYAQVRNFYMKQLALLIRVKDGVSSKVFSNRAGNLINCVCNTESALWLRTNGKSPSPFR